MGELKFNEEIATTVFETLDKDTERKILSTDAQACFATALCLLNISVGDLGKRTILGLNWSRAKSAGFLHRREVLQYFIPSRNFKFGTQAGESE